MIKTYLQNYTIQSHVYIFKQVWIYNHMILYILKSNLIFMSNIHKYIIMFEFALFAKQTKINTCVNKGALCLFASFFTNIQSYKYAKYSTIFSFLQFFHTFKRNSRDSPNFLSIEFLISCLTTWYVRPVTF